MKKIVKKEIGKTFSERVIACALMIPHGKVTTYGDIARAAGGGGQAARSVTAILGKASEHGVTQIPFHRIVYAGGRVWLTPQYEKKRMEFYKKENIEVDAKGYIKHFQQKYYRYN